MGCLCSKVDSTQDSYVYDTKKSSTAQKGIHQAIVSKTYFQQYMKRDECHDAYTEILI
jgi:hypothetical protein